MSTYLAMYISTFILFLLSLIGGEEVKFFFIRQVISSTATAKIVQLTSLESEVEVKLFMKLAASSQVHMSPLVSIGVH